MTTRSRLVVSATFLFFLHPGLGQTPASDQGNERELIERLIARIDQLERRVAELEGAAAPDPDPGLPPLSPAHEPSQPPAGQAASGLGAEMASTYPSLRISGFADVDFVSSEEKSASRGFHEGQFVLHFSSALSPRWSFSAETALTAAPELFRPTVERAILKYSHSDAVELSFGRFHTPVNWWNTAFHHGLWLQTTIDRPEMTRFGGEYIPVHFVGGLVEGEFPAGGLNLNYAVGIGNGRSVNLAGAGDSGDSNNNRAWTTSFFTRPERWRRLQVGGSYYRDQVLDRSGGAFRESISSAHLVWSGESPEIIAEIANVRHTPVGGGDAINNPAFYVQAAYRLPWRDHSLKPYYRYEYIQIHDRDAVFRTVTDLKGSTLGFRYDVSLLVALKAELRLFERARQERTRAGLLQLSFTF